MSNVTLNDQEFKVREVWACACSGACGGEWDPRCERKGGEYVTELSVGGVPVGCHLAPWDPEADRLVSEHGWRDLGDGLLLRPGAVI
jgi:hypothetical protein